MKKKYAIAIKQIKSFYPYGKKMLEKERVWCYLAFDNGPMGSGELVFSEFPNYRCYFNSVQSALDFWQSNKQTIYENWDLYDKSTISIREFTTTHVKVLSF